MDAWMREPGAWVLGHHAVVRGTPGDLRVRCTCGYTSSSRTATPDACLMLVAHLQRAVREGAPVLGADEGGSAGVREPRRPLPPYDSGSIAL